MGLFTRRHHSETETPPAPVTTPIDGSGKTILFEVPGRHVTSGNTSFCEHLVNEVLSKPDMARMSQGHFAFVFKDFEYAESVFLVPEVRRFIRTLHQRVKHLFYFLSTDPNVGQFLEFAVAFSPDQAIVNEAGRVDVRWNEQLQAAFVERLVATAAFATEVGDDAERVVRSITGQFMRGELQEKLVAGALDKVRAVRSA